MDYIDDEDNVELPCEFCEVLYPWSLLAEHQIVCELNPEVLEYVPFQQAENNERIEQPIRRDNIPLAQVLHPQILSEVLKPVENKIQPEALKPVEKIIQPEAKKIEKTDVSEGFIPTEPPKISKKSENQQNQIKRFSSQTEDFMTKTGEKLLVYGANIDPVEDLDAEKISSKMLNALASNIPKEEDVVDINSLSDDDCEETIEEFWKRARDFLKRNNKTQIYS